MTHQTSRARQRRGAMMVLIAVLMIAFMVTVAFSIDIAMMHLSRAELRAATDAASKAAASELSRTLDTNQAINRGIEIAAANTVNSEPLQLVPRDFTFGRSEEQVDGKFLFSDVGIPRNSVRVDGRRTAGSPSGPVPLFFGNIFGVPFFEPQTTATASYIERDVVLVVDRSGSMFGQKFTDLVAAIDTFVDTLATTPVDEQVGLASYNDTATQDVPLTSDLDLIRAEMAGLPVSGFTSISRGMRAGEAIFAGSRGREFVERTMIVMTDGIHNRGPEPRTVARDLAADGVTIHTITFGADADRGRMQDVAAIGRGRHFHADNGAELERIYREIALTLSTMMTQ
jgi:Ca-activated chloride channel homolog